MTPRLGDTFLLGSSQQLRLVSVLDPWLFELTWSASRAFDSPHALLPELQRFRDIVRCAALGVGSLKTPSKTADATLDCAFGANALFLR